ncbi:hypothetical protein [Sutcliffiella horikoshii]|uniref:hypothetical protein n=1 Tax=Sutcliffiella horikoshii TaxID=79883 RepID=UPI001F3936D3|nr:hypothetical protein [Sutcliffiella horikoshii]MCG1023246.1 hypothetical protein [Sutcliffiella horikoshii]
MKRKASLLGICVVFIILLAACSIEDRNTANVKEDIKEAVVDDAEAVMDQFVINEMESFSEVKVDSEKTLTSQEDIKTIQDAFYHAKKEPGAVDMSDPHYKVLLGGDSYYLWIHESSGTIMNRKDTHVIYSLSEEAAQGVYKLLDSMYLGD